MLQNQAQLRNVTNIQQIPANAPKQVIQPEESYENYTGAVTPFQQAEQVQAAIDESR
jgi:hypothetical protein